MPHIHNTLADAYNSFARGKMRCELPNAARFMDAMSEYAGIERRLDKLTGAVQAVIAQCNNTGTQEANEIAKVLQEALSCK